MCFCGPADDDPSSQGPQGVAFVWQVAGPPVTEGSEVSERPPVTEGSEVSERPPVTEGSEVSEGPPVTERSEGSEVTVVELSTEP
jgi:hypothetical protein